MDAGETESPHIEMIQLETEINPILAGAETLLELVERQYTPTIELEQDTGIAKEDITIEASEQRIDPYVTSLA